MKRIWIGALCLLLSVVVVQAAFAKGRSQVIGVNMPGATETIWSKDPVVLEHLSMAMLEDFSQEVDFSRPVSLGPAVEINRYYQANEQATPVQFDRVIYFRDVRGGVGYVYYYGLVNGWSEYDGHWFRARPEAERVLWEFLEEAGYPLEYPDGATWNDEPAPSALRAQLPALGLGAALGLAAGWLAWRGPART